MSSRPQRNPLVPLVNPSAKTPEELAESLRRIYAGALADHRSIEAGEGVYAVRVLAPLEVTDEGVGFNWHDPIVFGVLRDLIGDTGLVKVDAGDVPDYLINQVITYDQAPPAGTVTVQIVQPHGANTPLMGLVQLPPNLGGVLWGMSQEIKVHFKGTWPVTTQISAEDWRPRMGRSLWRCGGTVGDMLALANDDGLHGGGRFWPPPPNGIDGWNIVGSCQATNVMFRVFVDDNNGHLWLECAPLVAANYRGDWQGAPDPAYAWDDVVKHNGQHYQYRGPGNAEPPSNDWIAYTVPEAYLYANIDVAAEIPQDEQGYTTMGNGQ